MRYIDTGTRDRTQALGLWLSDLNDSDVCALRFQSGYFGAAGLAPLVPLIQRLTDRHLQVSCVLGSNSCETSHRDVEILFDLLGCPRSEARISIISYKTGLYHPKVYHVSRVDGSQAAYVGSANLTSSGTIGLNIEAGVILDTALGDPLEPLEDIASAVDAWFDGTRAGVSIVTSHSDIAGLTTDGILAEAPVSTPRSSTPSSDNSARRAVGLSPLVNFPSVPGSATATPPSHGIADATLSVDPSPIPAIPPVLPSAQVQPPTPWEGFPPYVLLSSGATTPTSGVAALSGAMLPGGVTGLIVCLNNDSARHFVGRPGTANLSIPVSTLSTLQFGVFDGAYRRPRAEFQFRARYLSVAGVRVAQLVNTNIMVYGHAPGETGHGDVRMLLPRGPLWEIRSFAENNGSQIPAAGDPMILEWPTRAEPTFKATFVDPNLPLFDLLNVSLALAAQNRQQVGRGACWLRPGVVPGWQI